MPESSRKSKPAPPSERPDDIIQVEDTLNNSNDLFLTFRKEMEDMSKKTKRLEKENDGLKRKHEAMNKNIFKMAEERTKHLKDLEDVRKKNEKLTSIINQMQQQGRGITHGMAGPVDGGYPDGEGEADGEESEYEDDEEGVSEDAEFDYDTEEEVVQQHQHHHHHQGAPQPPPRAPAVATNGHK